MIRCVPQANGRVSGAVSLRSLDLKVIADRIVRDEQGRPEAVNLIVRAASKPWWRLWCCWQRRYALRDPINVFTGA